MNDSHTIDDQEKELIALAIRQLRDRCNHTLNWLYPPPPPPAPAPTEDQDHG